MVSSMRSDLGELHARVETLEREKSQLQSGHDERASFWSYLMSNHVALAIVVAGVSITVVSVIVAVLIAVQGHKLEQVDPFPPPQIEIPSSVDP